MSQRTPSNRLAVGLACALGTLSVIAPATGKGAAPTTAGRSASGSLEFLETLRGASGKLEAAFRTPGEPLILLPPPT